MSMVDSLFVNTTPKDGSITAQKLADNSVTSSKISANTLKTINGESVIGIGDLIVSGQAITIDSVMSDSSTNLVQNKVVKAYTDTSIIDNNIANSQLTFTWTDEGYISPTNGNVSALTGYSYTNEYIDVSPFTKLKWVVYTNVNTGVAFYDKNKTFISGIDGGNITNGTHYSMDVPTTAKYLRFCCTTPNKTLSTIYLIDDVGMSNKLGSRIDTNEGNIQVNTEITTQYSNSLRLVDTGNLITGYEAGIINNANGKVINRTGGHYCTDFIKIPTSATVLYFCNIYVGNWGAWYDEDKTYMSGITTPTTISGWDGDYLTSLTVPTGAKYLRISLTGTQYTNRSITWCYTEKYNPNQYKTFAYNASYRDYAEYPEQNPLEYNGKEFCVFNKCMCIGDSITQGVFNDTPSTGITDSTLGPKYSYPTQLQKMSGVTCSNFGVGGLTSVSWNTYADEHFTLTGHDVAIINLGINDVLNSVSISDTETALRAIITKVKAACNNIKIFISTIVPAYADGQTKWNNINNLIRSLATELTDVYLIDITKYSITHRNSAYAQGHLTAIGYRQLAQEYMNAIGYIIKTNPYEFKDVQFINTNYTYTDT